MRKIRDTLLTSILMLLLFSQSKANADFDTAADNYKQKNYRDAFTEFSALAVLDDPRSQTVLALMYKYGEGVPMDLGRAFSWYQRAAKLGYAPAQFHTGIIRSTGIEIDGQIVVAKDEELAKHWLEKAAEQGFERAALSLHSLNADSNIEIEQGSPPQTWSKDWNFRLPANYRLDTPLVIPPQVDDQYLVQVGAMLTLNSANKLWRVLKGTHTKLFQHLEPKISFSKNVERPVYRIQTGPFENYRDANMFCESLLQKTVQAGCLAFKQK